MRRLALLAGLAWLGGGFAAAARAETLAQRFELHLARAAKDAGALAHWELAEAQRLAPLVPGGVERLGPVAARLAAKARTPWLQGEALGTLAGLPADTPSAAQAHQALAEAGVLSTGAVLGPLRGPGTEGDFADLPDVDIGRWRRFSAAALTGPLQLADLVGPEGDVHAVLSFAFLAQQAVDAMLVASSNGPLTVWLDGREVVHWDGERALTDWQHPIPVRLAAGTHQVVVRVGHRTEPPEVLLRLVDARGRLPLGVEVASRGPRLAAGVLAGWEPSTKLPRPLGELGTADPAVRGRLLLWASAGEAARREAARVLEEAIRAHPTDPELHFLLGRAEESDANRRRAAYERALALSQGQHSEALAELLAISEHAGLAAEADAHYRALAALDPLHPRGLLFRAHRLASWADAGAALQVFENAKTLPWAGQLQAGLASVREGMPDALRAAEAWARVAMLSGGDPGSVVRAVELARRAGRLDLAKLWVVKALELRRYAVELWLLAARLEADRGELDAALAGAKEAALLAPHRAEPHRLAADLCLMRGDRAQALAALDRALELEPQHRDTADRRRSLGAEQSLAERHAVPLESLPDASSVDHSGYLLDKRVVVVYPSGLSARFEQKVIAIGDERGAQGFSRLVYAFTPGEERLEVLLAEVRHSDGTTSQPRSVTREHSDGKQQGVYTLEAYRVIELGTLEAGDRVHVQLRRDEVGNRNLFGSFFGVLLPLGDDWPRRAVEVEIEAPTGRPLFAHAQGVPPATREVRGATQRWVWRAQDLPGVVVEPSMPGIGEVAPYVNVSTYASWQELIGWYKELIRPQLQLSPELVRTVAELVAQAASPAEKVEAIHGWVVRHTRYVGIEFGIHGFKPYRVTQVVERGYGDCKDKASLLVALLREAGIDARFVLVRTRDLGQLAPEPATLWAFNHAIVLVPSLGLYLDATDELAAVGEVPLLDQGAMVLHFDPFAPATEAPVLTTLPMSAPAQEQSLSSERLELDRQGNARGAVRETYRGTRASQIRRRLANPAKREAQLGALLAKAHPGARLTRASSEGLDALAQTVGIALELEIPGWARATPGGLELPLHHHPSELSERYGGDAQRRWPLVIDHARLDLGDQRVALPAGSVVRELPPPVDVVTPFGSYRQTLALQGGVLSVAETLTLEAGRVLPASYPAFRAFLQRVGQARARQVRVELP